MSPKSLKYTLEEINTAIRDGQVDDDAKVDVKQDLKQLHRRAERYRSTAEYISFVEAQLGHAHAIRTGEAKPKDGAVTDVTDWAAIDDVRSVDWGQVPLCGCQSPTCDAKRGDLPRACRDPTNGLLDTRTPIKRVKMYLTKHSNPHALRIAHRSWVEGYGECLAKAEGILGTLRAGKDVTASPLAEG